MCLSSLSYSCIINLDDAEMAISTDTKLGFQITNLYEFFMVFVLMSGIASAILFVLTKKLKQMMHEGVES